MRDFMYKHESIHEKKKLVSVSKQISMEFSTPNQVFVYKQKVTYICHHVFKLNFTITPTASRNAHWPFVYKKALKKFECCADADQKPSKQAPHSLEEARRLILTGGLTVLNTLSWPATWLSHKHRILCTCAFSVFPHRSFSTNVQESCVVF